MIEISKDSMKVLYYDFIDYCYELDYDSLNPNPNLSKNLNPNPNILKCDCILR